MSQSITVRSETTEWPELRAFADAFCDRHHLPPPERARLMIVLEELLTNLAKYGYDGGAPRGTADVTLVSDGTRLTIEFSDDGRAFDPLAHRAVGLNLGAEARPVGGLGLHIVRSFTTAASYRREGQRNHLRLTRDMITSS